MTSTGADAAVGEYVLLGRDDWVAVMRGLASDDPYLRDDAYNRLMAAGLPDWVAEAPDRVEMRRARFTQEQGSPPQDLGEHVDSVVVYDRTVEIRRSPNDPDIYHAYGVVGETRERLAVVLAEGNGWWIGTPTGSKRQHFLLPDKGVAGAVKRVLTA
jgi:hypothetical protein